MSQPSAGTEPIARFFDRECCADAQSKAAVDLELDRLSASLLTAMSRAGHSGGSVLEIGSGDGTLSREILRRGAQYVTGLDLSPESVSHARARAQSAGTSERLSYRVADGATATLEPHDAVVSEKVLCCFPDARALLGNTLPAARGVYALALPESSGPIGLFSRLLIAAENGWRRLRGDPFRAYVHDVRQVERQIAAAGFERRFSARQGVWRVLAYSRN